MIAQDKIWVKLAVFAVNEACGELPLGTGLFFMEFQKSGARREWSRKASSNWSHPHHLHLPTVVGTPTLGLPTVPRRKTSGRPTANGGQGAFSSPATDPYLSSAPQYVPLWLSSLHPHR